MGKAKPLTKAQAAALAYLADTRNEIHNPYSPGWYHRFNRVAKAASWIALRNKGLIEEHESEHGYVRLTEQGRAALKAMQDDSQ